MDEAQPVAERHTDMVHEFERRRSGAAFGAVHDDEVGGDAGLQRPLDHGEELPRVPDAELDADRLAGRKPPQPGDEMHHLDRRCEGRVPRWRDAVLADLHVADAGDLFRYLGGRQHSAVPGLCSLRELQLDHLDLRTACRAGRACRLLVLEEILAKLRPDMLQDEADMRRDRIVA
jgi:hypothetical protein